MSKPKYPTLDKTIIYTTGVLFLDVLVGSAFTGKSLHESFGIELPYLLQQAEYLSLGLGVCYTLFRNID